MHIHVNSNNFQFSKRLPCNRLSTDRKTRIANACIRVCMHMRDQSQRCVCVFLRFFFFILYLLVGIEPVIRVQYAILLLWPSFLYITFHVSHNTTSKQTLKIVSLYVRPKWTKRRRRKKEKNEKMKQSTIWMRLVCLFSVSLERGEKNTLF